MLFVLCVAIVLAVSLPVSTAFAAEGEPEATVHDHADGTWKAITADGGTLESGNYYLAGDVTLTTDITIADNATVTLCLNGYKLTGAGTSSVITVDAGASFTLEDCQEASEAAEHQHAYYINSDGLYVFDNDTEEWSAAYEAAENKGTVTGGIINSGNVANVGGISVDHGTFTMTGGTISGNTATSAGGVFVNGTFTMNGGTISGNTATYSGGGVHMYGGMFTMTGGTISGNTAEYGGGVGMSELVTFTMDGGTISGNTANQGGGVDVAFRSMFTLEDGTISGNTATADGGGVYFNGNTFEMSGGTISDNTATNGNGGGVCVSNGTLTMKNGTLSDNTATNGDGGGVYVTGTNSKFALENGTITGNTATNGGGVYAQGNGISSKFTITGGTISDNTAVSGGGMFLTVYTWELTGGTISGNMAAYGGGVYISGGNTFTMNGGTISGNSALVGGGGVHISGGNTFTMNDGYLGDGIKNYGTVSISGGYLSDESNVAYIVSGRAAHDISAFGTALDLDYIAGFPYAVYANGTEITASENAGIIYDGSPVAAGTDFTVTGADDLVLAYAYKTDGNYDSGLPAGAGTYTVKAAALSADGSYNDTEFSLTIAKATYVMSGIKFEDDSVPYNGEEQSLAISGDLPDGVTVTYEGNGMTNVGEYNVTASFTGDYANYNEINDMTAKLTITKADYDMSGITFADDSVLYNGEEQSLAISGTLPAGVTVTYEGNDKIAAGTYTITAKFAVGNVNYNAIPDMTATLTIEKGVPSYTAPTELTVSVGQNVADITLPDGWAWKDGDVQFGTAGEHKAIAVYTPADTANYNPVEVELTVTVSESEPTEPDQPDGEITTEEPEGLSGGAIAGIVIGCMLGVLLIEYGVFALLYRKKLISGAFFNKIYPFIKD